MTQLSLSGNLNGMRKKSIVVYLKVLCPEGTGGTGRGEVIRESDKSVLRHKTAAVA